MHWCSRKVGVLFISWCWPQGDGRVYLCIGYVHVRQAFFMQWCCITLTLQLGIIESHLIAFKTCFFFQHYHLVLHQYILPFHVHFHSRGHRLNCFGTSRVTDLLSLAPAGDIDLMTWAPAWALVYWLWNQQGHRLVDVGTSRDMDLLTWAPAGIYTYWLGHQQEM